MKKKVFAVGAVVLLVIGVLLYRAYLIGEMRAPVLALMSDPQSAQFQNEKLFSDWTLAGSALCGEVNVKNRMGGYSGFRSFVAFPERATVASEFEEKFKKDKGIAPCEFEKVAPWWHLR